MTDSHGRLIDFRNTLMVMTSNLGSQIYNDESLTQDQIKERVLHVFISIKTIIVSRQLMIILLLNLLTVSMTCWFLTS